MTVRSATAIAPSNIAFVKYWGKADAVLNTPAAGSLSMTLADLLTTTTVTFDAALEADTLVLDGQPGRAVAIDKLRPVLDTVRERAGLRARARVESRNDFPTGAGLASSASGMAALAMAAAAAAGLDERTEWLSALARRGSGSACRSLYGGFAEWLPGGKRPDGLDSYAVPVASPEHWSLRMLVVVVQATAKATSSTLGMARTAASSPYFPAFVDTVPQDLVRCRRAVLERQFDALTEVVEASALKLHAAMMTSQPSLLYWRPETIRVLEAVYALRAQGAALAFTIDAGPNVKVLLPPGEDSDVRDHLAALEGVQRIIETGPGRGARLAPESTGGLEAADGHEA